MSKETADNYGQEEYHPFWVAGHIFKPVVSPYTPDQDESDEYDENGHSTALGLDMTNVSNA
jgi:hypothetical protein